MASTTRGHFIKATALTAASFHPLFKLFARAGFDQVFSEGDTVLELYLLEPNLMNLRFYFFNVIHDKRKNMLRADCSGNKIPTMVVRIPQQHVPEEALEDCEDKIVFDRNLTGSSLISAFSYLSFDLLPNCRILPGFGLPIERDSLLSWGDARYFRLKDFGKLTDPQKKSIDFNLSSSEYGSFTNLIQRMNAIKQGDPWPISLIDLPRKLYVTPDSRITEKGTANYYFPTRLFHYHSTVIGGLFIAQEMWHNDLRITPVPRAALYPQIAEIFYDKENNFQKQAVLFGSVGFIESESDIKLLENAAGPERKDKITFVPSSCDRESVHAITNINSGTTSADLVRDIAYSPVHFTALGATTNIKYENPRIYSEPLCKILVDECTDFTCGHGFDLVKYIHNIALGRDEFVEVSRLGVVCLTGQKLLFTKIGKRKWKNGVSYVEYIEKVKVIEPAKDYTKFDYTVKQLDDRACPGNGIFKKIISTYPLESPPIVREDVYVTADKVPFVFWPKLKPSDLALCSTERGEYPVSELQDFKLTITYLDWGDNVHTMDVSFMYLSSCLFVSKQAGALVCEPNRPSLDVLQIAKKEYRDPKNSGRRKIPFHSKRLTYAPPKNVSRTSNLADPNNREKDDERNKATDLETEFVILDFDLPADLANKTIYPTLPQIDTARVFPENLKAISPVPIAAEMEFSRTFLQYFFGPENKIKSFLSVKNSFVNSPEYRLVANAFGGNVKSLGGFVNPDIPLKTLALIDEGMAFADDINGLLKSVPGRIDELFVSAEHIFRGDSPEILGIKIIPLLQALGVDTRPYFKVIEEVQTVLAVAREYIKAKLDQVEAKVKSLKDVLDQQQKELKEAEKQVQDLKNSIINGPLKAVEDRIRPVLADIRRIHELQELFSAEYAALKDAFYKKKYSEFDSVFRSLAGSAYGKFEVMRLEFEKEVKNKYAAIIRNLELSAQGLLATALGSLEQHLTDYAEKFKGFGIDKTTLLAYERLINEVYYYDIYYKKYKQFFDNYAGSEKDLYIIWKGIREKQGFEGYEESVKNLSREILLNNLPAAEIAKAQQKLKEFNQKIDEAAKLFEETAMENLRSFKAQVLDPKVTEIFTSGQLKTLTTFVENRLASSFFLVFEKYYELSEKVKKFQSFSQEVKGIKDEFTGELKNCLALSDPSESVRCYQALSQKLTGLYNLIKENEYWQKLTNAVGRIKTEMPGVDKLIEEYAKLDAAVNTAKQKVKELLIAEESYLKYVYTERKKEIQKALEEKLEEFKAELARTADPALLKKIENLANAILAFLGVQRKKILMSWNCDRFQDASFGFLDFRHKENPKTRISVSSEVNVAYRIDQVPPRLESYEIRASNELTDFSIVVFNALVVHFDRIKFESGTNSPTKFDIQIAGIGFEGAFSFLDAFAKKLQDLGNGFGLTISPKGAELGFTLPIPSISTPTFNFYNLSIGLAAVIPFNGNPVSFKFQIAKPNAKFGLTVGIYGGWGHFAIVAEPKNGIVELEIGLEFGGMFRLSFGPITGHIKLAAGFFYHKTRNGVYMAGYITCEGFAKIWIIEGLITFYMGVISYGDSAEGRCIVSYEIRIGKFFTWSFSAEYSKTFKGAKSPGALRSPAGLLTKEIDDGVTMGQPEWEKFINSYIHSF